MRDFGIIIAQFIKSLPNPLPLDYGIKRHRKIIISKYFNKILDGRRVEIKLSLSQHVKTVKEVLGEGSLGTKIDIPMPHTAKILLFACFVRFAIVKYEYPAETLLRALGKEIEDEHIGQFGNSAQLAA